MSNIPHNVIADATGTCYVIDAWSKAILALGPNVTVTIRKSKKNGVPEEIYKKTGYFYLPIQHYGICGLPAPSTFEEAVNRLKDYYRTWVNDDFINKRFKVRKTPMKVNREWGAGTISIPERFAFTLYEYKNEFERIAAYDITIEKGNASR